MQYLVTAHSWVISTMPPTYAKPLDRFNRKTHTVLVETDSYDEKPERLAVSYLDKMVDDFCEFKKNGQPRTKPLRNRTSGGFKREKHHLLDHNCVFTNQNLYRFVEDNRRDRAVRFDIGLVLSLPDSDEKWEVSSKNDIILNDRDFAEDIHRVALAVKSATPV